MQWFEMREHVFQVKITRANTGGRNLGSGLVVDLYNYRTFKLHYRHSLPDPFHFGSQDREL